MKICKIHLFLLFILIFSTSNSQLKAETFGENCTYKTLEEYLTKPTPQGKTICKQARLALHKRCLSNGGRDKFTNNCDAHLTPEDLSQIKSATSQDWANFQIRMYTVLNENNPKSLPEAFSECMDNMVCKGILTSAGAYVGVDPVTLENIAVITRAIPSKQKGEQKSYEWATPDGWATCRVEFHTHSIVPAEGRVRFAISATNHRVGVFTQAPKLGWSKGRSGYWGWVKITYVKNHLYKASLNNGRCNIREKQFGYSCMGISTGCNGTIDLGVSKKTVN